MGSGGVIVVASIIALLALIPLLVARRTAITQTREGDRYSSRLRLVAPAQPKVAATGAKAPPLLALPRTATVENGDDMDKDQQMRPRVEISRGAAMSVREIAKLRARRAARLSAEAAAGRRRLVISALCALVTVVVGGLAATSILQWAWIALPAAALAASLVASRMAAVRSERVGDEELALLASLKNGAAPAVRAEKTPSIHREEEAVDVVMAPAYEAEAESGPMRIDLSALAAAAGAEEPADAETDLESAIDTAPVERRTWTVASVPAPTYAMRGRVSGRMVHADTDLRGIPKVAARVPARPIEAVADSREARSTDEVVADQIISLDLDAVLDARRAL